MRRLFFFLVLLTATSAAATEPPNARTAYVERRGLVEADTRCQLLRSDIRAALQVGVAQARGSLLRAGWTNAQVRELDQTVVGAARARACNDARTTAAADNVRRVFASWANAGSMEFPGWDRAWTARRVSGGWRLSQAIPEPIAATFGVRDTASGQHLALAISVARGQVQPANARLIMRDVARVGPREISLTQRMAYGIAAGAAQPNGAATIPSTRTVERLEGNSNQVVFTFPDTAFRDLLTLDPRETVELRVETGARVQSLYVEVGDIAAARSFLTLR